MVEWYYIHQNIKYLRKHRLLFHLIRGSWIKNLPNDWQLFIAKCSGNGIVTQIFFATFYGLVIDDWFHAIECVINGIGMITD